jgi:hypothetical protein
MLRSTAVVLLLLSATGMRAAEVGLLDGTVVPGPLSLAAGQVSAGGRSVALTDCDWLILGQAQPATPTKAEPLGVWLVDGSWLPAARIVAAPTGEAILVSGPLGDLTLPLTVVLGWAEGPLPGAAAAGEDLVVVAGGPVTGRVAGLRDGALSVVTALDPAPLALAVADIKALHLAQAERKPLRPALLARTDPRRPPVRLTPDLGLAVAPAVRPDQAAVAALRLTVDTPRRVWLSDLTPASVAEEGAFGVVWPHRRDRDLDGQPIVLGGEVRAKGLTIHSKATLTWDVAGGYVRLLALVGISDHLGGEGDCDVVISGDGRELWRRTGIRGGQAPIPLSLDLSGVTTLTILVDTGARYDIGDHLVFADAGLVTR